MEHKVLKEIEKKEDKIIEKIKRILEPQEDEDKVITSITIATSTIHIEGKKNDKKYRKVVNDITNIARKYEKAIARLEIGGVLVSYPRNLIWLKEQLKKGHIENGALVIQEGDVRIKVINNYEIIRDSDVNLTMIEKDAIKEIKKYLDRQEDLSGIKVKIEEG